MAGGRGGGGGHRDLETEELIQDQQHRIRELERQVSNLKEKLMVAKTQLLGIGAGKPQQRRSNQQMHRPSPAPSPSRPPAPPPAFASPVPPSVAMLSGPAGPHPHTGQLLSQQAMQLLQEAKEENRALQEAVATMKEKLNIYEQVQPNFHAVNIDLVKNLL